MVRKVEAELSPPGLFYQGGFRRLPEGPGYGVLWFADDIGKLGDAEGWVCLKENSQKPKPCFISERLGLFDVVANICNSAHMIVAVNYCPQLCGGDPPRLSDRYSSTANRSRGG